MGLELVEDLQAVLDRAQVHERVAQLAPERVRQVAPLGEAEDRAQAVALAQPWVVAAVEELHRLDEELHLADAAATELDVTGRGVLAAEGAVDLRFHLAYRAYDGRVEPGPVDEGAHRLEEARGHRFVSRAGAGLDEGLALPHLGAVREVGAVAVQRQDQRARTPLGAQAQVHPEDVALLGDRLERVHDRPDRLAEEFAVGDAARLAARGLPVVPVDEDQVDVRGVIQLLASELAHADDHEAGGRPVGPDRRTVEPLEPLPRPVPGRGQAHVGHVRELLGGHGQVGVAQDVAAADAQELAVLEAAERVQPRLRPLQRP